jgi:hypothetical protein
LDFEDFGESLYFKKQEVMIPFEETYMAKLETMYSSMHGGGSFYQKKIPMIVTNEELSKEEIKWFMDLVQGMANGEVNAISESQNQRMKEITEKYYF